jgi:hypothetical protein
MAFTYDFDLEPAISYVRLLISDTDSQNFVFEDAEITAAFSIQQSQFQSAQFYTPPAGANLPASPVSYLRVAALLLDAMAANSSKLAMFTRILDVEMAPQNAAKMLREQAAQYRTTDDESGAFMIIEQVNNGWNLRDRYWKQIQRQQGQGWA